MKEGHDTTYGSILLVKWGGRNDQFAMVRVIGIIEDAQKRHSCKLLKSTAAKARHQIFHVELMDPVGAPTEAGSQKYTSSGYTLPKLAATLVLKQVELVHLGALAEPGVHTHNALLRLEDILEMYQQGFKRVTRQEGFLHIENEAERVQNLDSAIMWDAQASQFSCYISWSGDDRKYGVITLHSCMYSYTVLLVFKYLSIYILVNKEQQWLCSC